MAETKTEKMDRGIWLSFFLGLWIAYAGISCGYYFLAGKQIVLSQPDIPFWTVPAMAFLALVELFCYYQIWSWKRWAVFGAFGAGVLLFALKIIFFDPQSSLWVADATSLFTGLTTVSAWLGLILALLKLLLVSPLTHVNGLGILLFALWLLLFGLVVGPKWRNFK
ncbi:MAG TPA: hypothetical protein VMV05_11815 [bacterium]|nr:hypothetical protein [bacterium]